MQRWLQCRNSVNLHTHAILQKARFVLGVYNSQIQPPSPTTIHSPISVRFASMIHVHNSSTHCTVSRFQSELRTSDTPPHSDVSARGTTCGTCAVFGGNSAPFTARFQHTVAPSDIAPHPDDDSATCTLDAAQERFRSALENAHDEVFDGVVVDTSGYDFDQDMSLFGSEKHLVEVPLSGLLSRSARSRRKAHHAFGFRVDCIAKATPYTGTSRIGDYILDNLITDVDTMVLDALCAEEQRRVLEKYEDSFSFRVFLPEKAIQRHMLTLIGEGYAPEHDAVVRNQERMHRHQIPMPSALRHEPDSMERINALNKFRWKTLTRVAKQGRQGYEVAWQLFVRHLRHGCTTTRIFNTMLDACTSAGEQRVLWQHMLSHTGHQPDLETFKRIVRTAHIWNDTALLEEVAGAVGNLQTTTTDAAQVLKPPPQQALDKLRTQAIRKYLTMGLNGYRSSWVLYTTLRAAGKLSPNISTAMLHACKTPQEQLDTIIADAAHAGFAPNIKNFNRVIDRYLIEGDDDGVSAVLQRMTAAGLPTTDVSTAKAMHRRPEALADMQSDTLERLTEWEDPVANEHAVVDNVFRALIQNESVTAEHLEIMLYDARMRGDADRLEAIVLTGAHLEMLPREGSAPSIYRKLIRNIHSLSTIMLFLSIPPALITG
eukprot:m.611064 g.611064  ORF g.611064 m.611064 type:complete len:657 (+) comp22498_c0_seq6:164-2134(+)